MIAIGIGTTSGATADDIADAIRGLESELGQACGVVAALRRGGAFDGPIRTAAGCLGRTVRFLGAATLEARAADCHSHSPASMAAHAIPSVAEAAALAGAGGGSRVLLPRRVFARATAAAAIAAAGEPLS